MQAHADTAVYSRQKLATKDYRELLCNRLAYSRIATPERYHTDGPLLSCNEYIANRRRAVVGTVRLYLSEVMSLWIGAILSLTLDIR